MKVQLHTASVFAAITLLCGVSQALPRQARQDSLQACAQQCIDSIIQTGACDSQSDITQCVCQSPTLSTCVSSSCPPSFIDPTAEYCGSGPFSSDSVSSSQLYTIQTDTDAFLTKSRSSTRVTRLTATLTTALVNPSEGVSPSITTITGTASVTPAVTTSAAPLSTPPSSGNAAAPRADLPSAWKGLLAAGLGMMMAVAVA